MNAMNKQQERPTKRRSDLGLVLGGLVGALVAPACASHVSVPAEIATCPCANGAFCCSSGVCAADATGCDVATAALSNSVAGEWQGYFEDFSLSSDDSLKISIAVSPDGTMSGHVTIGQVPPPPPPTDPDAIWPPGLVVDHPNQSLPPYVAGFVYATRNIRWEAQRLRFDLAPSEAWQNWCALQTSYLSNGYFVAAGSYTCEPDPIASEQPTNKCFTNVDTGDVPCFKPMLFCLAPEQHGPCACDVGGCQANETLPTYSFDIALRDGIGDGSTSLTGGNIRLNQISAP